MRIKTFSKYYLPRLELGLFFLFYKLDLQIEDHLWPL